MRALRVGLVVIVPLALGLAVGAAAVLASHGGSGPHKKLFDSRWHYQVSGDNYDAWMNLETSAISFECGTSEADCQSRWQTPSGQAIDDWNSQPMTVRLDVQGNVDLQHDINVIILEDIFDDPGLLGFAPIYDQSYDDCFDSDNCDIWYGHVWASDVAHAGPYGSTGDRKATIAHELGHLFSLRHESVNANESILYPCGFDNTGVIPHSIMAYNCIDPVSVGGLGETSVQPWDVCGVNHAYFDPTIGYALCDAAGSTSPTPTLPPPDFPEKGTMVASGIPGVVGGAAKATLRAEDFPEPGFGAWTVDIGYNSAIIEAELCSALLGGVCNPVFNQAAVRISGASVAGVSGDALLASITFRCLSAGTSPLLVSVRILEEVSAVPAPMSSFVAHGTINCAETALGDVNCDDAVDATDALWILWLDTNIAPFLPCPEAADVNGDGRVDAVDALWVLWIQANLL